MLFLKLKTEDVQMGSLKGRFREFDFLMMRKKENSVKPFQN